MNLFSNTSMLNVSSNNVEILFYQRILEKLQFSNLQQSQNEDPVIKLLEDVKNRKIKVIIPSEEDIIPSLKADSSLTKNGSVKINLKNKIIDIEKPIRFPKIFTNQRSPHFPTSEQKLLLQKLKKIPIYVVVTNNNEMVMAMSRDKQNVNFLDWIYQKYYNLCVWSEDDGPISLGLFFMNKEDAELYLQEIADADPKMAEKSQIAVKMVGLDVFYKLNRTSPPGQQAKLIADLEEVEKIIQEYIPKRKHIVNAKQKYNKTSYKGNPIYIIKPIVSRNINNEIRLVDYNIKNSEYKRYIFFRLKDVYSAWDKFCQDNKNLKLPLYPNVEIYNLENYLTDLEQSEVDLITEISFVSTQYSFENLKLENNVKITKSQPSLGKQVKKFALEKLKNLHSFSKGVIWVLTSDTLPTEKNAW